MGVAAAGLLTAGSANAATTIIEGTLKRPGREGNFDGLRFQMAVSYNPAAQPATTEEGEARFNNDGFPTITLHADLKPNDGSDDLTHSFTSTVATRVFANDGNDNDSVSIFDAYFQPSSDNPDNKVLGDLGFMVLGDDDSFTMTGSVNDVDAGQVMSLVNNNAENTGEEAFCIFINGKLYHGENLQVVPEPSTALGLGLGALALGARRRRGGPSLG